MDETDWTQTLAQRLFEQRVVLLHGPLDDASVARTSADLMTLDAEGDEPVSLRIDCGEGSLSLALTLMDVIELMGVPVRALCLGQVGGAAIGVLAVCPHRAAMPSTRFVLREPTTQMEVHVRNAAQWSEMRSDERRRFCARVAEAVGQPPERVEEDMTRGLLMGTSEAVSYGPKPRSGASRARPSGSARRADGAVVIRRIHRGCPGLTTGVVRCAGRAAQRTTWEPVATANQLTTMPTGEDPAGRGAGEPSAVRLPPWTANVLTESPPLSTTESVVPSGERRASTGPDSLGVASGVLPIRRSAPSDAMA